MFKKKKLMGVLVAVAMVSALFAVNGASATRTGNIGRTASGM